MSDFVKTTLTQAVGLDFSDAQPMTDNYGNSASGELLVCAHGDVVNYPQNQRSIDNDFIENSVGTRTMEWLWNAHQDDGSIKYELGDLPSPLALRCGNHPTHRIE